MASKNSFVPNHSRQQSTMPLVRLIEQFASLPGIGPKTAQQLAYHVLNMSDTQIQALSDAILTAHNEIKQCKLCHNYSVNDTCEICADEKRDHATICVVENVKSLSAFERTQEYHGVYHIIGGSISPQNGIGPDELNIKDLIRRLGVEPIREVILATNPNIEGEATAAYISRLIRITFPDIQVSRIAYGVSAGSELENVDTVTLYKALENRSKL